MKEAPTNREQLINEIEFVADWDEEFAKCSSELQHYIAPQLYDLPEFEEYKEIEYTTTDLGRFLLYLYPFVYLGCFYYIYFHTNVFPDGFFKGLLIFAVVLIIGFILFCVLHMTFKRPSTEEEKEKHFKQYQEKKAVFDKDNLEKKTKNDKNYIIYSRRLEELRLNAPNTFIPQQYRNKPQFLRVLARYIRDYRANSFADALNLNEELLHQKRMEDSARRQEEWAYQAAKNAEAAYHSAEAAYYESKNNKHRN